MTTDDLTAAVARLLADANEDPAHTPWSRDVRTILSALEAAQADARRLLAIATMLDAALEEARTEFVRVPYGASHEDVAQINEWHAMAKEAREQFAAIDAAMGDSDA